MKTLCIGLIGCGWIASMHVKSLLLCDYDDLTAVCGTDPMPIEAPIAQHTPSAQPFTDYLKILDTMSLNAAESVDTNANHIFIPKP